MLNVLLYRSGDEQARQLLYYEVPQHFTWNSTLRPRRWVPRQQGATIGRVRYVTQNQLELYSLRLLLDHVRGPDSFDALKLFENRTYATFAEAAQARGLLESDDENIDALLDAARFMVSGHAIRRVFVRQLIFCGPTHPGNVWLRTRHMVCDDYVRRYDANGLEVDWDRCYEEALIDIDCILGEYGRRLAEFPTMPRLPERDGLADLPLLPNDQADHDHNDGANDEALSQFTPDTLNADQRAAFDTVVDALSRRPSREEGRCFFIDGPGGSGKTHLYNTLLRHARRQDLSAISVASTGAAALLLHGGRTAHSVFSIPTTNLDGQSTCSISVQSGQGRFIRDAALIIWDEAPMTHKHAVEAVDRTLRDIMRVVDSSLGALPFGGKVVVFGGDFRQVLPVVPRGSRVDQVAASISRSVLWRHVRVFHLTINMRLQRLDNVSPEVAAKQRQFAQHLLDIGDGNVAYRKCFFYFSLISTHIQ